ncbi:MAG: ABC transporter permease [Candidatus Acetothermia bacterium]
MDLINLLLKRKMALVALVTIILILTITALAPFVSPYKPGALNLSDRLKGPRTSHLFGTDHFGRDVLSRVIFGARITFLLGLSISLFAVVFGLPIGVLAGYFDTVGTVVMRVVDASMAFPAIMMALALMTILGGRGIINVIIAVGIVWAPRMVRTVYSSTLSLREETYIEASKAIGASSTRILVNHIVINLLSPVIVQATFTFAFSIMEVAALNFLGIGIPPYIPSWGGMMSEARNYIQVAPWIILFPGIFLAVSVLSFNLLGDAVRDNLDPKLRNEELA